MSPCVDTGGKRGAGYHTEWPEVKTAIDTFSFARLQKGARANLRCSLRLSDTSVSSDGSISASVDVQNTGAQAGDEVVQLYLHDPVASISQPVRRLRGFERVTLAAGEKRTVTFTLDKSAWGAQTRSHAAAWCSWSSPPRRSRRWISRA